MMPEPWLGRSRALPLTSRFLKPASLLLQRAVSFIQPPKPETLSQNPPFPERSLHSSCFHASSGKAQQLHFSEATLAALEAAQAKSEVRYAKLESGLPLALLS